MCVNYAKIQYKKVDGVDYHFLSHKESSKRNTFEFHKNFYINVFYFKMKYKTETKINTKFFIEKKKKH